jgi:hypothetical protein
LDGINKINKIFLFFCILNILSILSKKGNSYTIELWAKIEKDPPKKPFKSDGCSMWFDTWKGISLYPACFLHDLKYWAGYPGEDVERLVADAELMMDVARLLGSTEMAETMFHGVRIGGHEIFKRSFSWSFGRTA